jgi:TM2 domain-containing membrane protein YozV
MKMLNATRDLMLYDATKKRAGFAYLLWFFFGMVGAHRFYLGDNVAGGMFVLFTVGGVLLIPHGVTAGLLFLGIAGLAVLGDLFFVPGLVRKHNVALANRLC